MRSTFPWVLGFTLLAIVVAMLIPGQPKEREENLPWQIQRVDGGTIEVFGLTLGKTTLRDAELQFGVEAEISLFVPEKGEMVVEAYFDQLRISGLAAKMVLTLGIPQAEIEGFYERGLRIAGLGSGGRKVTLSTKDLARARQAPLALVTYIPQVNLDEEVVLRRFGEPAERIAEPNSQTVHWLYPDRGLDLALNPKEKEVLQYVPPAAFDRLREPLLQSQAANQKR